MERVVYQQMAELDDRHWWYRARRRIIADLIRREVSPPANAQILELGCGTGHNLAMLSGFGHVDGLELDEEARELSEKRLGRKIMSSPLPELGEVPNGHYDLIGAFDVIEHIDDDRAALASIATKLKSGGKFVMTVPAHQWMWSAHDVVNHHKRRYSKSGLKALIENSPMSLDRVGYFNSLLFPLAVAERAASKLRGKNDADVRLPPAPVNAAFEKVFEAERYLVGRLPLPPGLSLFAVASAR
ncbi:MAG: class I SAM-dependent methyltransferase [Sphingomonas sp.]|nr:class I SAM-dependent methyltransferase [Sphingomonas sp.]MBW0008128.1 class I SAM-dependent methyltransferase [Sphingomonas sp.]